MRLIALRLPAAAVLAVFAAPCFALGQNAAPQQRTSASPSAEFACAPVNAISSIAVSAGGAEINSVRARAVPGIGGSFNLFEVRYKVSNHNAHKIWVSGEFVLGYDGKIAGALSANSGLTGILPHESELIKGAVISKDVFFSTQNFCYRFSIGQQRE